MVIYVQALIDGLLMGGVYAIVAMGLSLAMGVMGVVNWAHGEMLMVSMYISYVCITSFGMDPYIAIFICLIIMGIFGFFLQKVIFNDLMRKSPNSREPGSIMISTNGMATVLVNVITMIFGSYLVAATTRYSGKTLWFLNDTFMVSVPKFISFLIAIAATLILYWFLQKTEMGRALRATSQNRSVARLMGIKVENMFCVAMAIAGALVGIAGGLLMPFYTAYPTVGHLFLGKAFIIVVLGGKGDVFGTLVAGLLIGVVERIGAVVATETWGLIIAFVVFIAVLLWKPSGLFSRRYSKV